MSSPSIHLAPRQLQLARLVSAWLRNKEIAHQLNLTEGTVRVYISTLFHTVGGNMNRAALAAWYVRNEPELLAAEQAKKR